MAAKEAVCDALPARASSWYPEAVVYAIDVRTCETLRNLQPFLGAAHRRGMHVLGRFIADRTDLPRHRGWEVPEMTSGLQWPSLGWDACHVALSPLACYWLQRCPDASLGRTTRAPGETPA